MQNSDEYLLYPGIGTRGGKRHAANVIFQMVQNQIVLVAVAEQQSHYGFGLCKCTMGEFNPPREQEIRAPGERWMRPGVAQQHSQQLWPP